MSEGYIVIDYKAVAKIQEDRADSLEEALQRIVQWADAYPLEVFPEPDWKRVNEVLKAAGLSLDQVSGSNMRHVVTGVGKIARAALNTREEHP